MLRICACLFCLYMLSACKGGKDTTETYHYLTNSLSAEEIRKTNNKLQRVANMWIGHFSNVDFVEKQSNPVVTEQEVIGVRVWPERTDGIWVYIGWFTPDFSEEALSQGIFKVYKITPDTTGLEYFTLPERADKYSHEWMKKRPFAKMKPTDLKQLSGCVSKVVKHQKDTYRVLPDPALCATDGDAGIAFIKLDILMGAEFIDFHTGFYTAEKTPIIQYKDGNLFKRLNKTQPKYAELNTQE